MMFSLPKIELKPYFYLPLRVGFPVANTTPEDIASYIDRQKEQLELRRQQEAEDKEWVRKAMIRREIF